MRLLDHPPESAADNAKFYSPAVAESRGEEITPARLRRAAKYLGSYADAMEKLK